MTLCPLCKRRVLPCHTTTFYSRSLDPCHVWCVGIRDEAIASATGWRIDTDWRMRQIPLEYQSKIAQALERIAAEESK